jgi:hypothetical protein
MDQKYPIMGYYPPENLGKFNASWKFSAFFGTKAGASSLRAGEPTSLAGGVLNGRFQASFLASGESPKGWSVTERFHLVAGGEHWGQTNPLATIIVASMMRGTHV